MSAKGIDLYRGQLGLQCGFSIHYCIGAALARLNATVAVQALVSRVRRVELCGEVIYNRTIPGRGSAQLPLRLEPGPGELRRGARRGSRAERASAAQSHRHLPLRTR